MGTSTNRSESERWRRHRAARVVARHARDARDRAELLDMLGLTAARFPPEPDDGAGRVPAPRPASEAERDLAANLLAEFTKALR